MKIGERRKEAIGLLCKELPRSAKRKNAKIRRSQLTVDVARAKLKAHYGRIIADVTAAVTESYKLADCQLAG